MKKFEELVNELFGHALRFTPDEAPVPSAGALYEVEIFCNHDLPFFELLRYGQDVLDDHFGGRVQIKRTFSHSEILQGEDEIYHSDEDGTSIMFDTKLSSVPKLPVKVKDRKMGIAVYINRA